MVGVSAELYDKISDAEFHGRRRTKGRGRELPARVPVDVIIARFALFGDECLYCGRAEDLTLDHFFPLRGDGGHVLGNMVPACLRCNSSKKHSDPIDWMRRAGIDGQRVQDQIRRINTSQGISYEAPPSATPAANSVDGLAFGG